MVFITYLTTVFDNIKDAILLVGVEPGPKYRLLMANKGFSNGTGHSPDDVGKTIDEFVIPETYHSLCEYYGKAVTTKKTVEFIETYNVPMGHQTFHATIIPVINAVGEVAQLAVISQNITELHELREIARTSAETLEQLARELREA
jgi:PAS domain-containing protein